MSLPPALFELEEEPPRGPSCGWGAACRHPAHWTGPYERPERVWGTVPCHECGAPLRRYLRVGHWNLDASTWEHLRAHAREHLPVT